METSSPWSSSPVLNSDDPSFSPYLRSPDEPKRVSKEDLQGRADYAETGTFKSRTYPNEGGDTQRITKGKRVTSVIRDGRHLNHLSSITRYSSASSVESYRENYEPRSFHSTLKASSKSSCNSQAGPLGNAPGKISEFGRNTASGDHKNKKNSGSAPRWLFGRKCPCLDSKSVQVKEKACSELHKTPEVLTNRPDKTLSMNSQKSDSKSGGNYQKKAPKSVESSVKRTRKSEGRIKQDKVLDTNKLSTEDQCFPNLARQERESYPASNDPTEFTFPILNLNPISYPIFAKTHISNTLPSSTNSSSSLETYQHLDEYLKRNSSTDVQNRILKPLKENQSFTLAGSPKSQTMDSKEEDDSASNGSSDLFEITTFSTTPSNGPSKATVDWRVNTTERFHRTGDAHCPSAASKAYEAAKTRQEEVMGRKGGPKQ